jgi:hypothetical protein
MSIPIHIREEIATQECSICSQLTDHERGFQKMGEKEEETHLPPAAYLLKSVRNVKSESGGPREIWQCPECTTCYLYRFEHEFLYGYGGSEDTQELTRLTASEAVEWLQRSGCEAMTVCVEQSASSPSSRGPGFPFEEAPLTSNESVSVDASEPGFVSVHYVQLEDGVDMGGRLLLERKSVPLIIELLQSCLNVYDFPEIECQCGDDAFRVYGSGSDQQSVINILNRRRDVVPHQGLTGLMLTHLAAEVLLKQLRELS